MRPRTHFLRPQHCIVGNSRSAAAAAARCLPGPRRAQRRRGSAGSSSSVRRLGRGLRGLGPGLDGGTGTVPPLEGHHSWAQRPWGEEQPSDVIVELKTTEGRWGKQTTYPLQRRCPAAGRPCRMAVGEVLLGLPGKWASSWASHWDPPHDVTFR